MVNTDKLLKTVWFTPGVGGRWGLPLLLEGKPGTAKTSVIGSAAARFGLHCEAVIASVREPADIGGLPVPQTDGSVSLLPAAFAQRLARAPRGLLFFDEINTAPPATQAALLRVLLEGVVGDLALPPGVRMIAACNPTEEAAGGWELAPPLANRLGHRRWACVDAEAWADWMLGGTDDDGERIDPAAEETRVLAEWPIAFADAKGLMTAFIRARPELLHRMPAAGTPGASKAWPSPRTVEMATRAIAGARIHGMTEIETDDLVTDFVGAGFAGELAAYRAAQDLPSAADVLDGKVVFKHDVRRLDRTVAVLAGCSALVTTSGSGDRAVMLWRLLDDVSASAADLVVPAARVLVRARLSGLKEARPVLTRIQPVLAAAGIGG